MERRDSADNAPADGRTRRLRRPSVADGGATYRPSLDYVAGQCVVTSPADDGVGSLRAALGDATCPPIAFDLRLPVTTTLTSGHLTISRDVSIEGPEPQPVDGEAKFSRRDPAVPDLCRLGCSPAGTDVFDAALPSEPTRRPVTSESDGRQGDPPPAPSSLVALEVALLSSAEHGAPSEVATALVVASDDDERTYVADALHQRADLAVIVVATVAAALEAAARRTPRVIVATHDARAVVRHLPAVAAVLLSNDTLVPEAADASRLAPIVVLRGAFRGARLLEVVATLIGEQPGAD